MSNDAKKHAPWYVSDRDGRAVILMEGADYEIAQVDDGPDDGSKLERAERIVEAVNAYPPTLEKLAQADREDVSGYLLKRGFIELSDYNKLKARNAELEGLLEQFVNGHDRGAALPLSTLLQLARAALPRVGK